MAGPVGPGWRLAVACAWLGISRAERACLEEPCRAQVRNRMSDPDMEGHWVITVAVLSSVCATWIFIFYALQCLCTKMGLRGQGTAEPHGKLNESSPGPDPHKDGVAACPQAANPASPTSSPKPRCGSRPPVLTRARRSYARQLACMEHELEAFLRDIRTRRCALGEVILAETCPSNQAWQPGRLQVTVYEAADYESAIQQ
ncbi:uncharacterized protein LOC134294340 isoform X2 [Anolis carolinensis]|uniref:uncharacterized protein LOC134294340 isoform X2 n=1 Tax=Anolis carolinensis TaxID=28377 RepID=UPI002F2B54A5